MLAAGSRLGPYEIVAPLGAGGMGEVYRARDPRLGREVALKVLPAAFSDDADRLRRFEQEARAAGLLNHPGITAVFDIGRHDGSTYVVSELLEGETLRARLAGGALPVRKALDFARQIAHGLAAAHDKGIVHRDLKPENLFVTEDGRVKILDFGLAKLVHAAQAPATNSPTATVGTEPGVLLGTIGYMAPEQVRGKPADQRSDIFAFGAILHEMLSGKRAFQGDSAADTMSAILREDPQELSTLNTRVPPGLERIVRHCLEKSPGERFHSAHDLAFQLEAMSDQSGSVPGTVAARPSISSRTLIGATLLVAAGALAGAALANRFAVAPIPDAPTLRYLTFSGDDWGPSASPDGKLVAFVSDRDGTMRIWLKELAGGNEVPLTSGPDQHVRFAPDGSTLYFQRSVGERYDLYRVPVVGGEPRKLLENVAFVDPSPDGRSFAFLRGTKDRWQLWITSADGSGERMLTALPSDREANELRWSPDGRQLAAVLQDSGASLVPPNIALIDAQSGQQRLLAPVSPRGLIGRVAWEPTGEALLYTHVEMTSYADVSGTGRLVRQEIDSGRARSLVSFPRSVGSSGLALLGPGRLVLDADASRQNLREEDLQSRASDRRFLTRGSTVDRQPAYSPDAERIVFTGMRGDNYELWEISRKTGSLRRLTDHPAHDWDPAYTPDGTKLIWSSNRSGNFEIWTAAADGSGPRQLSRDGVDAENPTATPDGAWIVYASANPAQPGVWKIRSDGSEATRIVEGFAIHPEVSPDGRYVLWFSETPGEGRTLHVHDVADGRPAGWEIRGLSDWRARWLPDGKRIAFVDGEGVGVRGLFVQDFSPGRDTRSTRRPLVPLDPDLETESFGISPDGSRVTLAQIEYGSALLLIEGLAGLEGSLAAR